jgi:MFS family permease
MCLPMLASTVAYASIGTLISGWFPPRVRYTGLSMSFQTAGLIGTLAPAAATWLFSAAGNSWTPVALAFAAMALVSAVCLAAFRQTPLTEAESERESAPEAAHEPTPDSGERQAAKS